ncbi:glycerate kinase [Trichinella spiralis]|uniref:glycerate kinase n=1 Tax=Trichinella spiralis TaxID=6334 RepID=UPI0001EFCC1F|nr:glycerate kinase [Trichinella spiralis]
MKIINRSTSGKKKLVCDLGKKSRWNCSKPLVSVLTLKFSLQRYSKIHNYYQLEIMNLIYKKNPDRIFIPSRHEHYVLNNNVYIVGFGKAAFGMCQKAAEIVDKHLVRGIASVPVGTMEQRLKSGPVKVHPRLEVYEGAKDNIPDESALRTSKRILNMVLPLKEDAILLYFRWWICTVYMPDANGQLR